jgi:hypothetical protein
VATERVFSTGGRPMGMIINKIKDNKLFYAFIFIAEISYLLAFTGLVWPLLGALVFFSFLVMALTFFVYFGWSFFKKEIKPIRKEIVLFLLFRISLLVLTFYFFVEIRK